MIFSSIGITPACAGKTQKLSCCSLRFEDHPRVCGKNSSLVKYTVAALGSPPRVREKRISAEAIISRTRITPACAGKTITLIYHMLISRDHPRVCGKNDDDYLEEIEEQGSPPRVREKPNFI
ncbi:hypothetical protein HMPREF3232_00001 [Fannyhessea vaginae]|nr:hypothetical protein HMPREF3232_00001 [Fannyhessea vaginae]